MLYYYRMPAEKVNVNSLGEDEREMYFSEKMNKFKLTVTICTIYAVIAFVLLLVALFTSWGQKVLYDEMFPFVLTYIFGTIVIVSYLAYEVYTFKPYKNKNELGTDAEMCPDYWKIEHTGELTKSKDIEGKTFLPSDVNQSQFNYRCVLDPKVFRKANMKDNDTDLKYTSSYNLSHNTSNLYKPLNDNNLKDYGIKNDSDKILFKQYMSTMAGYNYNKTTNTISMNSSNAITGELEKYFSQTSTVPIVCDQVYPIYMSVMDNQYQINNPDAPSNKFRCAYAKACNITWTDAGCPS